MQEGGYGLDATSCSVAKGEESMVSATSSCKGYAEEILIAGAGGVGGLTVSNNELEKA